MVVSGVQIEFPIDDEDALIQIERGFTAKSSSRYMRGCVGAVDGYLVKIRPPNSTSVMRCVSLPPPVVSFVRA